MKIFISHSRNFDYENELYKPIINSALSKSYTFVFPHIQGSEPFDSKKFFRDDCDLVLAEVSYPATGLGIELGFANMLEVPIVCFYKKDSKISGSLKVVTNSFFEYVDSSDLIVKLSEVINNVKNHI